MDHGGRARLLGHGAELRRHGALPHPRRARQLRLRLPAAALARVRAVRVDARRLPVGPRRGRARHVVRGVPRVSARAPRRPSVVRARGGRARRRDPVDGVRRHADDRERVLSDLPLARVRAAAHARPADARPAARRARALRARVRDARADGGARPGRADGAARARVDRARPAAAARRLQGAVRHRRRRGRSRRRRRARARPLAVAHPRQLLEDLERRLPLLAGAEVARPPSRRARPLRVGRALRRADRPRRERAASRPPAARLRRGDGIAVRVARARGRGLRVALLAAHRGAESLLSRAAAARRAARLDRAGPAAAAARCRRRCRHRGRAPGRDPVPAPAEHHGGVRHARLPAVVVRRRRVGRTGERLRRRGDRVGRPRRDVPLAAAPVGARPAGARGARLPRHVDPAGAVEARLPAAVEERPRAGHRPAGQELDRLRRRPQLARRGALVGRQRAGRVGERVLEPQRRPRLQPRLPAAGRHADDQGRAQPGDGRARRPRRQDDHRPVRAREQLGRPRRHGGRARPGEAARALPRDATGTNHHARHGPVPDHRRREPVVEREPLVDAAAVRWRHADRRRLERQPAVQGTRRRRSPSRGRRPRARSRSRRARITVRSCSRSRRSTASATSPSRSRPRAGRPRSCRARPTRGCSASTSTRSGTRRRGEDRRRRVAAVARAHRRRQLHPRLAAGDGRGVGGSGRGGRVRAGERPRQARDRGGAGRARRDVAAPGRPARRARAAHCVEPRRVAAAGASRRPARRLPFQRLDVSAAARRDPLDDGARPRAAASSRMGAPADAHDARREVPAHGGGMRRRHGQLALHRRRRRGDARRRSCARSTSRIPASIAASSPTGNGSTWTAGATSLTVATLEPRKNLSRLVEAYRQLDSDELSLLVVGAAGWGDAAGAGRAGHRAARLHAARGSAAALPRRERGRLSVAVRGLRDAGGRGDGVRRSVRRLVAPVARRGVRRRGGARRPGRCLGDRRCDRAGARRPRRARSRGASSTRAGSRGSTTAARTWPRGRPPHERRRRRDRTRADARRHGPLPPRAAAAAGAAT